MNPLESPDRLVLGIDFGTTFSGVAYSYSAQPDRPDDINIVRTWPGGNLATDKVPSEIAYGASESVSRSPSLSSTRRASNSQNGRGTSRSNGRPANDIFNFTPLNSALNDAAVNVPPGQIRWGYQLRPDETRLRCIKLFLESDLQIPNYVSKVNMQKQLQRYGKDPAIVVADYLTELFKHAKERLVRRYGDYFVKTTRIEVVLTVPAIWSDAAKDATLNAAKKAGMGPNIRMISEPEAAAVYTIQATQPNHLKVGDNFVVCDAGGGTVDLISYEIKKVSPLRIEETVRGTGACCGSVFLNINFEEHVRSKLGDDAFRTICERQPMSWLAALRHFEEHVKRVYDPTESTEFNIPFPGVADNPAAGINRGFLTLSSETVGTLFKPIMGEITRLVEEQMQRLRDLGKPINSIVLVGGFGQSKCLYRCLHERFANMDPPPPYPGSSKKLGGSHQRFEILQPDNAWTAVARGAVLRGLEGAEIVLSRKSRRHYGTGMMVDYNSAIHRHRDRVWNEYEQKWKVHNRMRWYIEKGDTCSSTEPILFPFYQNYQSASGQSQTCSLIVSNEDIAPSTSDSGGTETVCKLVVNLEPVPSRFWKDCTNSIGRQYKSLDFVLGMQIESGGLRFDLRIDDVVYGEVVADFNFS